MSAASVPLTQGLTATVSSEDAERVLAFKWHARHNRGWYAATTAPGTARGILYLHRFILDAPKGILVDHIDRNGLNNRRENLRFADHALNNTNRAIHPKGIYRGVTQCSANRWEMRLKSDGIFRRAVFCDPVEAAKAYDSAAREIWGARAVTNFPEVA